MKSKIFGMVVTLTFAFSAVASGAENDMRSLLIYGDSLSAAYGMAEDDGWVALLELRIRQENRPYRVVNGSVSGETSTGGLERLPSMLRSYNPDIVVLELGGNDGLRGLPLHLLKNNLRQMIALIHQSGAKTLLSGIQIPPNYGPRYATPFYELFYQIAEEDEVAFIPFLIALLFSSLSLLSNGSNAIISPLFFIILAICKLLPPAPAQASITIILGFKLQDNATF